jgi:hypothetical protein
VHVFSLCGCDVMSDYRVSQIHMHVQSALVPSCAASASSFLDPTYGSLLLLAILQGIQLNLSLEKDPPRRGQPPRKGERDNQQSTD